MDKTNAILQVGFREIFAIPVIHASVKWNKKNGAMHRNFTCKARRFFALIVVRNVDA